MYSRLPYSRGGYGRGIGGTILVTVIAYLTPVYSSAVRYLKAHKTVVSFTLPITGRALLSRVIVLTSWVGRVFSSATSYIWYAPWLTGIVTKFDSLKGRKVR